MGTIWVFGMWLDGLFTGWLDFGLQSVCCACFIQIYTPLRFGENTAIAGVNNAAKSKSRIRAFIWTIIFVGLAALTVQGIVAVRHIHVSLEPFVLQEWSFIILSDLCWLLAVSNCDEHRCELQGNQEPGCDQVTTDVNYQAKIDFPAVTICNLNRINCHNAFQV